MLFHPMPAITTASINGKRERMKEEHVLILYAVIIIVHQILSNCMRTVIKKKEGDIKEITTNSLHPSPNQHIET